MRPARSRSSFAAFNPRRTHLLGVLPLCGLELSLLLYRDLRDSFMPDILRELGSSADPATFASVDVLAGVVSLAG